MLIRFTVENFLSFKNEVEFSMLPGRGRKHPEHIISNGTRNTVNVLKAGVIYGANASGKSNLIKAMDFAKNMILEGRRPRQMIPVMPFKFEHSCEGKPSKFQFEFKTNSRAYIYGFLLDSQKVHSEWLYEIASTTEKPIFERNTNENGKTTVKFSNIKYEHSEDRDFLEFTGKGTRPNQLFLTESMERNVPYFRDIFDWFEKVLVLIFPESRPTGLEINFMTNEDFQESFRNFLQLFDTGISGIDLKEFDFDEEKIIPNEIISQIKEEIYQKEDNDPIIVHLPGRGGYLIFKDDDSEIKALKLMTIHQVKEEERDVLLEIYEESDGTQRLFDLVPALMELFSGERVFVIDELDRSLHPHLSYKILELFLNNRTEQMSQLIVTTHEANILDLDLLRRDEIWFVEKNKSGVSTIYSLEEFAPRYDKDIRKGYLLGRFGAIPFIKNVENLGWLE